MADKVKVIYEDLDTLTNQFHNLSDIVKDMMSHLDQCIDALQQGGWLGMGADAFYSEMEGEVYPAIRRLHHTLDDAANVTRQINQTFQQADEDAAACFNRLQ